MFPALGVKARALSASRSNVYPAANGSATRLVPCLSPCFTAGAAAVCAVDTSIVHSVALAKTTAPAKVLFFKGALCNWHSLSGNLDGDSRKGTAKFCAVWWCLLAFIAHDCEHSVANMTLFALSRFGHRSDAYTALSGIGHNLLWVTLGNTLSGVVFMGLGYWYATPKSGVCSAKTNQIRVTITIRGNVVDHLPIFT
ncbi:formate/nitrite transporter family protein [Salmonella enterica subsp. enterica]|nr:formate/nitrite transporter family protein [Salmonella enterica subsp. enterica]